MDQLVLEAPVTTLTKPDTSHLVTEDDTPVDNFYSEKNERLLVRPIYSADPPLFGGRPFVVAANVGVFYSVRQPAIVPDVFLSLDVEMSDDWWETAGRSYLMWEVGKPPDVVIEIVSNRVGEELTRKRQIYARMRVTYYVVYDPDRQLQDEPLTVFELRENAYVKRADYRLPAIGIGLTLWEGIFEGKRATWLRWCDQNGRVIPTGQERAASERRRAEQERTRAEQERARAEEEQTRAEQERTRAEQEQTRAEQERTRAEQEQTRAEQAQVRAEQERARAERLATQLRALGIDPEA
jgi:ribosomal protein L14E/L6E/L27E